MRSRRTRAPVWLALAGALLCAPAAAGTVPEPPGFRTAPYRAPVPATLEGARVIDTSAAEALWRDGAAAFVDVLPMPQRPENLPQGTLWNVPARHDIPGSVWLANTGYDRLSPAMDAYFADGLRAASAGDLDAPLVFYCLADCWMSWNAAKRALSLGYTDVRWYPEGTDGWSAAGLPLEERTPAQLP